MLEALDWQRRQPGWLKDGGQFVPYPASWLNARSWEDEPFDQATPAQPTEDWYDECRRIHGGECGLNRMRHHMRKAGEQSQAGVA
jgi:hypothetical protein